MKKLKKIKRLDLPKLWIIPMVFFAAQQSSALGLGEIRVDSYLGEPLKAQVEFVDLSSDYETNLKVRLASPDEYKKSGYSYPYDVKFKFLVVNETGKQAVVRISSSQTIDDPYLTLLLEVSSPTGRFVKTYTFLIDPSPDLFQKQNEAQPALSPQKIEIVQAAQTHGIPPVALPSGVDEGARHKRDTSPHKAVTTQHFVPYKVNKKHNVVPDNRIISHSDSAGSLSNKLSLTLSTSLTISHSDPGDKANNDALQEELIAKEKTLSELNAQIAEMHSVITNLQSRLNLTATSSVANAGRYTASGVSGVAGASHVITPPSSVVTVKTALASGEHTESMLEKLFHVVQSNFRAIGLVLLALILAVTAMFVRRKRAEQSTWGLPGLFDDVSHSSSAEEVRNVQAVPSEESASPLNIIKSAATSPVLTKTLAVGEQSIKVPAYKEAAVQQTPPVVAPEYDLLEEADIYLRFGHDKLAEEVLRDALKINPSNPEIYMSLLGIFDTRGDALGFEATALELKTFANDETWKKVVAMGKKLDADNLLYQ